MIFGRPGTNHQSGPRTSPLAGVHAAHQVPPDIDGLNVRTLASPMVTTIPPTCGVEARDGSQLPAAGCTWKIDAGPMLSLAVVAKAMVGR